MQRRDFLTRLMQLAGLAAAPTSAIAATQSKPEPLLLQTSPVAGFQYHLGETFWAEIKEGAELTLTREPENRHDPRAIRVEWQGNKLGYLPRLENATLASLMDRGHVLSANVASKRESRDPWQRLALDVFVAA
ncbi:MAG: HIRAN domain-containing protein [Pseudomonadota bacterium]|nr:HIRAN domain-containing protein [Pseudomonadota bacterium]